jgi:hypothetical protein
MYEYRLASAEAPENLIDDIMGHKSIKPEYGRWPSLELKRKWLHQIASSRHLLSRPGLPQGNSRYRW